MEKELTDNRKYLKFIYVVSALIPLVVAFLIFFPAKLSFAGDWVKLLPGFHAMVNSLTAVILVVALIAIKKKQVKLHRALMFAALFMGVLFLVSYVIYHSSVPSVKYGDLNFDGMLSPEEQEEAGNGRILYLSVLASHIILSILVVPFVLMAFYYALTNQIARHKKMVKYTYPVWLYVSVTGVLVYLMISPYYF